MIQRIKEAAKMLAALVGAILTAGSTLIPESWSPWLSLTLAVATAVATYVIPNAPSQAAKDAVLADLARLDPDEQNADIQAALSRTVSVDDVLDVSSQDRYPLHGN